MKKSFNEFFELVNLVFKIENKEETNNRLFIYINFNDENEMPTYKDRLSSFITKPGDHYNDWMGLMKNAELHSFIGDESKLEKKINKAMMKKLLDQMQFINKECKYGGDIVQRMSEIAKINQIKPREIDELYKPRELNEYNSDEVGGQYTINEKPVSLYGHFKDLKFPSLLMMPGTIKVKKDSDGLILKLSKADAVWETKTLSSPEDLDKEIKGLKAKQFKITPLSNGLIMLSKMSVPKKGKSPSFTLEDKGKLMDFNNLSDIFKKSGFKSASSKETKSVYFINGILTARVSDHVKNVIEYDDALDEWTYTIILGEEESSYSIVRRILEWTKIQLPNGKRLYGLPY